MNSSFRWKSAAGVEIDAFFLGEGRWFLFAYVLEPGLESQAADWVKEFSLGEVAALGGALKTEKKSEPLPLLWGEEVQEFLAYEHGLKYRLETQKVLNPGLFLDQGLNRLKLRGMVDRPGTLLNLFSYTGAFSVLAAHAGAAETTSVDVSARYLSWERANHEANALKSKSRFIRDDARDFLKREAKRGNRYDWIVLDPPTFSKGQGKAFQVRNEFLPMLENAVKCLKPKGAILASLNDSRWSAADFYKEVEDFARGVGLKTERGKIAEGFSPKHPMKSLWLF